MKRILVATDAWRPQVNGVVRSLEHVAVEAPALGADLAFLTPNDFATLPLPGYAEIRLALATPAAVAEAIDRLDPDCVHIATEGPIGLATRRVCLSRGRPFTTSYHTRFPEYLRARLPVPLGLSYAFMRYFHNAGSGVMVSTPSLQAELAGRGFQRIMRWTRGVDTALFRPREGGASNGGPVFLYVGRVAVEKNIEAFLGLDLPGRKVVVGDGPMKAELEARHRDVVFTGVLTGERLAKAYAEADVFVFPSVTDTFGIVLLEALAAGLPIAAFPVTGPKDVIEGSGCGVLDADLAKAAQACLDIPRERCRAHALTYGWRESARQFLDNIALAHAQPGQMGSPDRGRMAIDAGRHLTVN